VAGYWDGSLSVVMRRSLEQAQAGRPTLLLVEGPAGAGKSTFLVDICDQARRFTITKATGLESLQAPFDVLRQLGIAERNNLPLGSQTTPFLAAQSLRDDVDRRLRSGPALLCVDDLHWADKESVDSLVLFMRRLSGEKALVVVATRPLPPGAFGEWQRLTSDPHPPFDVLRIKLNGLSIDEAAMVMREYLPGISTEDVRRLREHTAGSPLYIRALMSEYNPETLLTYRSLPAPADFASVIRSKLARLDRSAAKLCQALSVLGTDWEPLTDVGAVAGLSQTANAADDLSRAGIVELRSRDLATDIRMAHALVRAAVYQDIAPQIRRDLHLAAAGVVPEKATNLEHRFAAAQAYDDHLSEDLQRYAQELYGNRSFRMSARVFSWASQTASAPSTRRFMWIESLFCSVLAKDRAPVAADMPRLLATDDAEGRAMVLGALALLDQRWGDAVRVLLEAGDHLDDSLREYRAQSMLSWARLASGQSTADVIHNLERLEGLSVVDPVTKQYADIAAAQAIVRLDEMQDRLDGLGDLPSRPSSVPVEQTWVLALRGAMSFQRGLVSRAIQDLQEAQRRIDSGFIDITDGATHGVLGSSYWFNGQWDRASLYFGLGSEIAGDSPSPLLQAHLPLLPAGRGQFALADNLLQRATDLLTVAPWHSGVQALIVAEVICAHAKDDADAKARIWPRFRRLWPDTPLSEGIVGPLYLIHVALAAAWAGETVEVERLLELVSTHTALAPWAIAATSWVRAVVAEQRGDVLLAAEMFKHAALGPLEDLPLYRAHILSDAGRIMSQVRQCRDAGTEWPQALGIYRLIGATPYVARLEQALDLPPEEQPVPAEREAYSDRERDILTLLIAGLSYTQIAREMFITRSTVGYHLSRIYTKSRVSSRHELARLARQDPARFGLSGHA